MSITQEANRIGVPTASQAYRLMGTPAVRATYLKEKEIERRLKVSASEDNAGQAAHWGKALEMYVIKYHLPIGWLKWNYGTVKHESQIISGTPDIVGPDSVGDIKCYYRKKFAIAAEIIENGDVQRLKKELPEIYWQITANADILDVKKCMLLLYLPKESELEHIRECVSQWCADGELDEPWKYRFIYESDKSALPYQADDSDFGSVMAMEWDLNLEDVSLLHKNLI